MAKALLNIFVADTFVVLAGLMVSKKTIQWYNIYVYEKKHSVSVLFDVWLDDYSA